MWSVSRPFLVMAASCLVAAAPETRAVPKTAPENARARISREGDPSMERLRSALDKRKPAEARSLPTPVTPDPAFQRRAFDAMRTRSASPALDARARAAVTAGEASLAASREAMAKRLAVALGLEGGEVSAAAARVEAAPGAWTPVLFVSSSIPVAVLRTYAAQLERVRGVIALRGVPGGMKRIGPLAKLTAEVLRVDPACSGPNCIMRDVQVIVDPIVFRQHAVTRVPALAMIPGDPTQPYCERNDESLRAVHVIYGDAALSGLFDAYSRLGGRREVEGAQRLLARN